MSGAMHPPDQSWRVWLDLARAGNLLSVASNVLAALVLAAATASGGPEPGLLALTVFAGCLAYAGGATLNDVADAAFDARHRPERAIPRGRVTRRMAAWVGGLQLAAGCGLLVTVGASAVWVAALATVILVYDWNHKRWSGSVILMAGCRVLLAVAIGSRTGVPPPPAFFGWIGALFVYIAGLSLVARCEYRPGTPAARLGRIVGRMLAFIPLVDAAALLAVGAWLAAAICALAVPLGLWSQRRAAST